jgi:hypothetical protein
MKTKEIGFKVENGKRTETFYQERKQETLEEAAERLWLEPTSQLTSKNSFIQGAKWQQEQDKNKYSEEEVIAIVEKSREKEYSDAELANYISSSQGAFHTLKSRLNDKIAQIVSKKLDTPIKSLMVEANKISAHIYTTNKQHSIRYLKELEKQLAEYGLFNEIANIHKTLAILSSNREEKREYLASYNKHVAYNLALSKAENIFFSYLVNLSYYELNPSETEYEKLRHKISELNNISQLHHTHKLFVLLNICTLLFINITTSNIDDLKMKEIEVENQIKKIEEIFNKYEIDEFYINYKFIVNFLFAQYYTLCENFIRGYHFYEKLNEEIQTIIGKSIFKTHFLRL